ncbi:hypothetical protein LIER_29773 [Lithospermum erythrorhizon]|uniref:Uncharacterized protein n=1 Tax=Lithospermum erythrorhizon TaxID=34254 RepID=A0AAV3RQI1_LITER
MDFAVEEEAYEEVEEEAPKDEAEIQVEIAEGCSVSPLLDELLLELYFQRCCVRLQIIVYNFVFFVSSHAFFFLLKDFKYGYAILTI